MPAWPSDVVGIAAHNCMRTSGGNWPVHHTPVSSLHEGGPSPRPVLAKVCRLWHDFDSTHSAQSFAAREAVAVVRGSAAQGGSRC